MKTEFPRSLPALFGAAALFLSSSARGATVNVDISGFAFQPADVSVQSGDTVVWTQKDSVAHTSTSDSDVWSSPFLSVGQTFSHTFSDAGSFPYFCAVHPFMKGSVSVQAATANQAPTVRLTSPADGATVTGSSVILQADASDSDGSIAKIEFFQGTALLGSATTSPYSFTWSNVAAGSYTLTAKATDNAGATTTSAPVQIQVTVAAPPSAPHIIAPITMSAGKIQFTVQGTLGQSYQILSSSDARTWTVLDTLKPNRAEFTVSESIPSGAGQQFYQVRIQ